MDEALQDEKVIFHAALALSEPEERRALLNRACGNDIQLRARIEALLTAHAREDLLEHPAPEREAARMTTFDSAESTDNSGTSIGRYKLLQKIGEGGFGIVYMAEQQQPVVRRVALKIIKPGMDTKQVIARFEAERQALAMMEHPNIAQVFDAGETENGRPYFVMELVKGVSIIEFCDQQKLTNGRRLELFLDVCQAVQHAHQKGVIHRDLKPSNILVTVQHGEPLPKVIDFGIAKATLQRLTEKTLFTRFEQFVGTPAYMSPEQAQMSSLDVDTRSDIYSLGVLLYELLTGTAPFDAQRAMEIGIEELRRCIQEEEFPLPSKRVSSLQGDERTSLASSRGLDARSFPSKLKGDLDWIVMKAVDKDRRRRYDTASAFAADVQRFLKQKPVAAAAPSISYHLRKFIRRNRTAVMISLAVALSLVLGTAVATTGWLRAIDQKEQANTARAELTIEVAKKEAALQKAENETARAVAAENAAMRTAYLADMQAAHQALHLDNLLLARQILNRNRIFPSGNDPRHWEWRALWLQCQSKADRSFGNPKRGIPLMDVSPDGRWFAAGGGSVQIWDTSTGEMTRELDVKRGPWCFPDFSTHGNVLFVGDGEGSISSWKVPSFESFGTPMSHSAGLHDLEVSPDGKWVVTIGGDNFARVWDVSQRTLRKQIQLSGEATASTSPSVAITQHKIALTTHAGTLHIFDIQTLDELQTIAEKGVGGRGLTFSPDGKYIAGAGRGNQALIHRASDGKLMGTLKGHAHQVTDLAYSPDGKLIATASRDHTVRLWDSLTHEQVAQLSQHEHDVYGVAFTADGKRLFSTGKDGQICVWKIAEVAEKRFPIHKTMACEWWRGVCFSPDGKLLAATKYEDQGSQGPGFDLRSTKDLEVVETVVSSPDAMATGVRYSPVEDLLVVGYQDGSMEFVDLGNQGKVVRVVVEEGREIFPSQFTRDGERLLVYIGIADRAPEGAPDTLCAVYSVADRRMIASWPTRNSDDCASIAPTGNVVATGHNDGVRFWSLSDLTNPILVPFPAMSVDFSPDGKSLVAGTDHGTIGIIDVDAKRLIDELVGHKHGVGAVRFSNDGKRVASAGSGRADAAKLWDFDSRREIMTLMADGNINRQIEWSRDGNSIVLMGGNANVNIWRVPSMQEISEVERTKRQDGP